MTQSDLQTAKHCWFVETSGVKIYVAFVEVKCFFWLSTLYRLENMLENIQFIHPSGLKYLICTNLRLKICDHLYTPPALKYMILDFVEASVLNSFPFFVDFRNEKKYNCVGGLLHILISCQHILASRRATTQKTSALWLCWPTTQKTYDD